MFLLDYEVKDKHKLRGGEKKKERKDPKPFYGQNFQKLLGRCTNYDFGPTKWKRLFETGKINVYTP